MLKGRNNINPCLTNRSLWWRVKSEERETQSQWNDWRRKQRSMRRTLWGRHPTAHDHCDCIKDMVELWKTRTTRDWPYGIRQWQILIQEIWGSQFGKSNFYRMIPYHPYQNLINERHLCKNNNSLTHIFQLSVS